MQAVRYQTTVGYCCSEKGLVVIVHRKVLGYWLPRPSLQTLSLLKWSLYSKVVLEVSRSFHASSSVFHACFFVGYGVVYS